MGHPPGTGSNPLISGLPSRAIGFVAGDMGARGDGGGQALRICGSHPWPLGGRVSEQVRVANTRGEFPNPRDLASPLADDELGDNAGRIPHWYSPMVIAGYSGIHRCCLCHAMQLASIRQVLTVYRMVFGQPRQDDLLEFILHEVPEDRRQDLAAALTIDLSPPKQNTC